MNIADWVWQYFPCFPQAIFRLKLTEPFRSTALH